MPFNNYGWNWGWQSANWVLNTQNDYDFQLPLESFQVTGNIYPSVFVTLQSNGTLAQSTLGDIVFAVSQVDSNAVTPYAAQDGGYITAYGHCYECWLYYGETINAGEYLKPDVNAHAIVCDKGDDSGAIALEGGFAGELHRVRVKISKAPYGCYRGDFTCEFSYEF